MRRPRFTTHDLPTLAGFWLNSDIRARHDAGVFPDDASYRQAPDQRLREALEYGIFETDHVEYICAKRPVAAVRWQARRL